MGKGFFDARPIRREAEISEDGRYRYLLIREWGDGPLVIFAMLNPSTADAEKDDPTIRRCMRFAHTWGFSGIIVVNLFGFRATSPKALLKADDPVGEGNHYAWIRTIELARAREQPVNHKPDLVCAWGTNGSYMNQDEEVLGWAELEDARTLCLGRTKDNHPRHPLGVPTARKLVPYDWPIYHFFRKR